MFTPQAKYILKMRIHHGFQLTVSFRTCLISIVMYMLYQELQCVVLYADVFPSTCVEWQSLECFTGTFEACHVDLGKLMYAGETSSELANRGVFFFAATYVVPQRGRFGALEPISAPAINSLEWPIPDPIIMESFQRRIFHDIQSSLKPTYGSHRIIVSLFMPLHVFIAIFKAGKFHRTPTMWISKDGTFEALDTFLKGDWTTKVAEHQGDVIKCSAVMSMVRCRYQIGKQNLTMVYPIRRWKRSRGEWEALDSDLYAREEVELHIEVLPGEEHTVVVNDDWNFAQLRERIVMSFNVRYQFKFVVSNRPMRHRSEKHTLCVSLEPPRVLSLKEC